MRVVCLLLGPGHPRRQALAEACLAFSPQIAVGSDAVFVEIEGSRHLFSPEECIQRLREILELLDLTARIAAANTVPSALAFARYGVTELEQLPVEALSDYLQPFNPEPFAGVEVFRKLGTATLGDFRKIPRAEIPARFGKQGLLAYERLLEAHRVAWPRWAPEEKILERADFDCAAQVHTFEPVLFLLRSTLERVFLRLYARRLKLAAFRVKFHLNRLSGARGSSSALRAGSGARGSSSALRAGSDAPERVSNILLPLPQSEVKSVLHLAAERLQKELENRPLEDSLEGVSLEVLDTAPFQEAQRDFFSKREEESQAWAALVGRLEERLGSGKSFLATPAPRRLPEASWKKTLNEAERGTLVEAPLRPLRLVNPPVRLQRNGDCLLAPGRRWRLTGFQGPEKLEGEWWLGGFEREYFRVETESGETLWVFTAPDSVKEGAPRSLWLHGFYD